MAYGETPPEGTLCKECPVFTDSPALATKDYNGKGYWLCDKCYEFLDRLFDEDYK